MEHPLAKGAFGTPAPWLVVLVLAAPCGAAGLSGTLDPTFGTGGKATVPIAPGVKHDEAFAAALDAQDSLVLGGYAAITGQQWALARLLENGTLDSTFGDGGTVVIDFPTPARVQAIAVQDDGKIVTAGSSRQGGSDDFAIARLLPDGDRDPGFGIGGTVITSISRVDDVARALAVQPDGRIVVAGFARIGAQRDVVLARYLSDGSLDPSFGNAGTVALPSQGNDEAYALALQEDGEIPVTGYATDEGGQPLLVARLTDSGALDPSFGGTGFVHIPFGGDSVARALALVPDRRILVAGGARVDGVPSFVVARLAPDGTLDPTFGDDGKVATPIGTTAEGRAIVLHPRGRFTVAGRARVGAR